MNKYRIINFYGAWGAKSWEKDEIGMFAGLEAGPVGERGLFNQHIITWKVLSHNYYYHTRFFRNFKQIVGVPKEHKEKRLLVPEKRYLQSKTQIMGEGLKQLYDYIQMIWLDYKHAPHAKYRPMQINMFLEKNRDFRDEDSQVFSAPVGGKINILYRTSSSKEFQVLTYLIETMPSPKGINDSTKLIYTTSLAEPDLFIARPTGNSISAGIQYVYVATSNFKNQPTSLGTELKGAAKCVKALVDAWNQVRPAMSKYQRY